jgi:hypothetical protein
MNNEVPAYLTPDVMSRSHLHEQSPVSHDGPRDDSCSHMVTQELVSAYSAANALRLTNVICTESMTHMIRSTSDPCQEVRAQFLC